MPETKSAWRPGRHSAAPMAGINFFVPISVLLFTDGDGSSDLKFYGQGAGKCFLAIRMSFSQTDPKSQVVG
jgi:hypothetical protein